MKIKVTVDQLSDTIRLLEEVECRLKIEAAALARLEGERALVLAQERLDAAHTATELLGYYFSL
jgi:hypothetical protein